MPYITNKNTREVDPGRVINLNGIRAQIEGAILMGLSAALKERITVKNAERFCPQIGIISTTCSPPNFEARGAFS